MKKQRKKTLFEIATWLTVRGQRYACEDAERLGELELYIRIQKRLQLAERNDILISARSAQKIKCAFCRAGVKSLPDGLVLSGSGDSEGDTILHDSDGKFGRGQNVVR